MQKLTVTITPQSEIPNGYLVSFQGDFDGYAKENVVDIEKLLSKKEAATKLIFDFSKLNFLNSYAIGHLVAWRNQISEQGGNIIIVGANKSVQDIFSILGINKVFQMADTPEEAVNALKA